VKRGARRFKNPEVEFLTLEVNELMRPIDISDRPLENFQRRGREREREGERGKEREREREGKRKGERLID